MIFNSSQNPTLKTLLHIAAADGPSHESHSHPDGLFPTICQTESSRWNSWRVATGGLDKKLIIWDQHSSSRCICDHEEGVTCLLWLAGSRYIATGCLDGKVRIWDSLSGNCAKVFSDAIQSIAASCTGEFLVSVSFDNVARVFEIAEFR